MNKIWRGSVYAGKYLKNLNMNTFKCYYSKYIYCYIYTLDIIIQVISHSTTSIASERNTITKTGNGGPDATLC